MKQIRAGLVLSLAAAFAVPAFAQNAAQVAVGVAPLSMAQPGRDSVQCESVNMRPATCPVPWREAVLVRQTSNSSCVEGRTWGMRRGAIWVDRGCSGVFAAAGGRPGHRPGPDHRPGRGGWAPGPDWDRDIRLRCGSPQFSYNLCQVDTGRGSRVYIKRQLSDTRCVEGRNWGWNRGGIWVDKGCSAEFIVERRWR